MNSTFVVAVWSLLVAAEPPAPERLPYVIEPPDILRIDVGKTQSKTGDQKPLLEQINGEHLVRPDGTVGLGTYGSVFVTDLTLEQANVAIQGHLARFLRDPEVTVEIQAFNSKAYYVITDVAGHGQQVYRFPITGKETVRDAINAIGGIPSGGSPKKVYVLRPAPGRPAPGVFPVDWAAISECRSSETNWPLLPGDRVEIRVDRKFPSNGKFLREVRSPIEQCFDRLLQQWNRLNLFAPAAPVSPNDGKPPTEL
jgi:protein involved in polysaccharide export with SLBB domain